MQRASVDFAVPQVQILNAFIHYPSINSLVVTVTAIHESVICGFPLSSTRNLDKFRLLQQNILNIFSNTPASRQFC